MRKSILAIIGSLILQGCQSTPIVKTEVVYVNKEVIVPCVKQVPTPPAYVLDSLPKDQTQSAKVKALRVDRLLSKSYIQELEAVVAGCK